MGTEQSMRLDEKKRTELYVSTLRRSLERHAKTSSDQVWLTPEQAARYLPISRRSLERLMEDTPSSVAKPWRKLGRTVRWRHDDIDRWVDALNKTRRGRGGPVLRWAAGTSRARIPRGRSWSRRSNGVGPGATKKTTFIIPFPGHVPSRWSPSREPSTSYHFAMTREPRFLPV